MEPVTMVVGALVLAALVFGSKKSGSGGPSPPLPGTQAGNALYALGMQVKEDILQHGKNHDPNLLRAFQAGAKIAVDGLYGPESALALARVIGETAPPPLYAGAPSVEFPPAGPPNATELDKAKDLATQIYIDVTAKRLAYDKNLVKAFQRLARLGVDGLYGPATAGAVQYFTDKVPPTPLYKGASGTYDVKPYTPPK